MLYFSTTCLSVSTSSRLLKPYSPSFIYIYEISKFKKKNILKKYIYIYIYMFIIFTFSFPVKIIVLRVFLSTLFGKFSAFKISAISFIFMSSKKQKLRSILVKF